MKRTNMAGFRTAGVTLLAAVLCGTVPAGEDAVIKGKPVSTLVGQLRDQNRGIQVRAARALSEAPEKLRPEITKEVIPILKSERENDRFVAAQVLGEYGTVARAAVPDILPLLEGSQFERNRAAAAKALGQILEDAKSSEEITGVTKRLVKAFKDQYEDVRREAVTACGMIGPAAKESIAHYAPLLKEPPGLEPNRVSVAAAWACERMGSLAAEHVDLLIGLLHSQGFKTPAYVTALGAIGPVHENVAPNIVDAMELQAKRGVHQVEAWQVLQKFGPKAETAVPFTGFFLSKPPRPWEPEKRVAFIEALKFLQVAGPKAKEALPRVEALTNFDFSRGNTSQKKDAKALRDEAIKTTAILKGAAPQEKRKEE